MAIGKSKLSDMDSSSFESSVEKNIEADKASDRFDHQLQAYKEATAALVMAKAGIDAAKLSMAEAKNGLDEAVRKTAVAVKSLDDYTARINGVTIKAKLDDSDLAKLSAQRERIIKEELQLLEEHRAAIKKTLSNHFYEMTNQMSRNKGVWLSDGWVKALLWIFLPCVLFTITVIVAWIVLKCG